MMVTNVPAVPTQTWVSIVENALSEFRNTQLDSKRMYIKHLINNVLIESLFRAKQ